ncbi:aromatic amino acid lyase [Streptomyces sp. NBC_01340]|uniref:aromatic amino acid ammonia-lyase n=1 Tax=unclassified Streptomyces TaxID=2593676 RepID=UPI002257E6A5|nr:MULTISPECIES: aromatic amino acid ammonia-lyase [unclassified Streptomyces]MCX4454585.1 aromatic amino acid lyase [Streptomyces sp. NBC_01719]MCX4493945.1 aromatic amino acid lyase [Streptomyces sp. NBC_01728]MCX4591506.1 aromatic amino acid lyase [Streptomyces sp. NBC_01549]WSI39029.1 aromatic amino acid lyase [Streptomyces sp. NBC_01340]
MSSRNADMSSADATGLTVGLVVLDGCGTGVTDIVRLADGAARPVPGTEAMKRVEESWDAARQIAATGRVYGRSTGVGANRNEDVPTEAAAEHGLRLLRSHAGAIGEELPARQVRAMLAVRANQLLAGGAGLRPTVVTALCEALETGAYPVVNEFGSVGTGDIAALAQVGLALVGEHPWRGPDASWAPSVPPVPSVPPAPSAPRSPEQGVPPQGQSSSAQGPSSLGLEERVTSFGEEVSSLGQGLPPAPQALDNNDALALISSNALTLGQAALALDELRRLIEATQVVAALSLLAVDGSHEAYAAPVHAARPHKGSVEVARRMRELIGAADRPTPPLGRIQDPYGFRCVPQIHGPAQDAADALEGVLVVEINAAAENPLISPEDMAAYHHGGFYQAQLALALDHFRLAVTQVARLSTSRLSTLNEPAYTRLRPFLADHEPASSGVMILEYAAAAALGDLRAFSAPASLGHAVLSRGVEEQASFASLAARQTLRACGAYRLVVGCELVSAVRALRQRDLRPDPELPVGRAMELAESVLGLDQADRPLTDDVTAAAALLDRFTDIWRGIES